MADFTSFLYSRLPLLKIEWPDVKMNTVTDADLFYSDGSSAGSVFKLVSIDNKGVLIVMYVFPDGDFTRVRDPTVNQRVFQWVQQSRLMWILGMSSNNE